MTEVAPLPSSPHLQASAASCASDFEAPTPVSPRTVRFYCADVPDLSEFFYSKSMSDVNIMVGDRKIAAHRSRLASVSPFLASIFASDTSEVSTVVLPDVSFAAVNVLINFLYSGFMRVTKKEIAGILEVATLLGISYPIDIEETELGVVRIKPQSAKKRSVGQEDGIGLMAKKARMGGPKVVIFEGLAKNTRVDKLLENLETPAASPRREAETVTLMDVDEAVILSNSLVSDHSFEIVNVEGNSRTVSPNTAPDEQITDVMSTPTNKEQMVRLEIFDTMEVATDLGDEQLLTDEQIGEPEANLNDSDSLLQPVVLSVQGNIEMHDETDETAILNELAPVDTETLPLDEEESHEEFHNIVDTLEPVKQSELNDVDDAANKDQESNAAVQESESEQESESAEQEDESAEQEDESVEQEGESAEEEEQTNETNVEEVLSEQEDESAGGNENEGEQDDVISDECEQQDQTEEDGSSDNAEEEAEKKDKEAESPSDGVDLNETVFFSPDSNRSDAEAIEATDDTDSFKSTE